MVLTLFGITLFAVEEYIILDLIHVGENKYFNCKHNSYFLSFILLNKNVNSKIKETHSFYFLPTLHPPTQRKSNIHNLKAARIKTQLELPVSNLEAVTDVHRLHRLLMFSNLKARDAGGSMVIHTFGGYYGLSISWMLYRPNLDQSSRLQRSVYHSDVFAMIGG